MDMAKLVPCSLNSSNQNKEVNVASLSLTIEASKPYNLKILCMYKEATLAAE